MLLVDTMLLAILFFALSAVQASGLRLTLSHLATFNTPTFVEGLQGSTKFLALVVPTKFSHFTGIPLVNEAVVSLDQKRSTLKVYVRNNGFLTVYRPGKGALDPIQGHSSKGVYFEVVEGDLVVMISTWGNQLEMEGGNYLKEALETFKMPLQIGEKIIENFPDASMLSFIIARVATVRDAKLTYTRLVPRHDTTSSDSFEGPNANTFRSERKESLVLRWSSEDEFGESFVPRTDATPLTEIETQDVIISEEESSPNPFRTTRKENCILQ